MADLTLRQMMAEVLRMSTRLEAVTDEIYRVAKRLAEATHEFEQAEAEAWLKVRAELGARDEAGEKRLARDYEAQVTLRVAEQARAVGAAKAEDGALDAAAKNLRGQLSACQSVGAALREEMRLAGGPG